MRRRSSLRWALAWEQQLSAGYVRLWYRLDDGLLHPITLKRMLVTPETIPTVGERLARELDAERAA